MTTRAGVAPDTERVPLLDWLESPRGDRELRFAGERGAWHATSYDELAALTRRAAVQLAERGVVPGDVVAIVLPTGPEFVATFYAALIAGATPCPIAPAGYFQDPDAYRAHMGHIVAVARPRVVATNEDTRAIADGAVAASGVSAEVVACRFDADLGEPPRAPRPEIALLQFTSGSTRSPRGVRVTADNLEYYMHHHTALTRFDGSRPGAYWLPLYHDMGLIGGLLPTVSKQGTAFWMRPDQFVREPVRWLGCLGREGATITFAPTFAFAYVNRRVTDDELAGMDFSQWSVVGIGAERVVAGPLHAFAERLAPHGFSPRAFSAAYGLAEATLGATGMAIDELPVVARVDPSTMRFGERLEVELGGLADAARSERPSEWLVGCGRSPGEMRTTVVDANGEPLPDRHLGEIVVSGPTVAAGYVGGDGEGTRFVDGTLYTRDAGFYADGNLFVVGRMGDMLTVGGRNLYVDDLEARVADVPGVPKGRFAVVPGPDTVAAIVEAPPGPWVEAVERLLARHVGERYGVSVVSAPGGTVMRTSSGKPRRRAMWLALVEGRLPGTVVAKRPPPDAGGRA